ncbi:MAG TPA: hypothetical protein VKU38_13025 [Ktedonobacteraceae bacterium]|nr:hypothetical protein [Ktedonobacteraceae bacterium]
MTNFGTFNAVEATTRTRQESLHPDIVTFCTLLARIMYRCLMEHNVQIIPWTTTLGDVVSCTNEKGVRHGQVA